MSEVPLYVPLRHSLVGGAFMATVSVSLRGSLRMAYSRNVGPYVWPTVGAYSPFAIQGTKKSSLGGTEWTD